MVVHTGGLIVLLAIVAVAIFAKIRAALDRRSIEPKIRSQIRPEALRWDESERHQVRGCGRAEYTLEPA